MAVGKKKAQVSTLPVGGRKVIPVGGRNALPVGGPLDMAVGKKAQVSTLPVGGRKVIPVGGRNALPAGGRRGLGTQCQLAGRNATPLGGRNASWRWVGPKSPSQTEPKVQVSVLFDRPTYYGKSAKRSVRGRFLQ